MDVWKSNGNSFSFAFILQFNVHKRGLIDYFLREILPTSNDYYLYVIVPPSTQHINDPISRTPFQQPLNINLNSISISGFYLQSTLKCLRVYASSALICPSCHLPPSMGSCTSSCLTTAHPMLVLNSSEASSSGSEGVGKQVMREGKENIDMIADTELTIAEMWRACVHYRTDFASYYACYHYYRSQGWVVRCGLKVACSYSHLCDHYSDSVNDSLLLNNSAFFQVNGSIFHSNFLRNVLFFLFQFRLSQLPLFIYQFASDYVLYRYVEMRDL